MPLAQDSLGRQLQKKEKLREDIKQQLEKQTNSFDRVEKDAQALLHKALHAGRKITVNVPTIIKLIYTNARLLCKPLNANAPSPVVSHLFIVAGYSALFMLLEMLSAAPRLHAASMLGRAHSRRCCEASAASC